MAYEKKKLTAAELSAIRAAAGRKGAQNRIKNGNNNGGRKPALKCDTDPTTSCTIRKTDSMFIDRMSFSLGIAKAACIRVLVLAYRRHCSTFQNGDAVNAKLDESFSEFGRFTELKSNFRKIKFS